MRLHFGEFVLDRDTRQLVPGRPGAAPGVEGLRLPGFPHHPDAPGGLPGAHPGPAVAGHVHLGVDARDGGQRGARGPRRQPEAGPLHPDRSGPRLRVPGRDIRRCDGRSAVPSPGCFVPPRPGGPRGDAARRREPPRPRGGRGAVARRPYGFTPSRSESSWRAATRSSRTWAARTGRSSRARSCPPRCPSRTGT